MVEAANIGPGDHVSVWDGTQFVTTAVANISSYNTTGAFHIHANTHGNTLVVDGVLTSTIVHHPQFPFSLSAIRGLLRLSQYIYGKVGTRAKASFDANYITFHTLANQSKALQIELNRVGELYAGADGCGGALLGTFEVL
jgi:hypothetical protein